MLSDGASVFSHVLHFPEKEKEQRTYDRFPRHKQMKEEDREKRVLLSHDGMNCQVHMGETKRSEKSHQRDVVPLWE